MLIEFRVENHRSLRDEQVLTMESGRGGEAADPRPRQVDGTQTSLLPVVAVYGANASGKTNVLLALAFMRDAVLNSFNNWGPDQEISRNAFAWGKHQQNLSRFDVTFLLSGIRYEYGFCLSDTAVEEEWLFAWPNGKKQVWFEREASSFRFGDHLKGDNRIIEGVTRGNALFLSTAVQFKHQQLQPIFSWFRSIQTLNVDDLPSLAFTELMMAQLYGGELPLIGEDWVGAMQERFLGLLRNADLGIVGLKVNPRDSSDSRRRLRFEVKHQSEDGDAWLPLAEESKGTRTLFRAGIPILQTIEQGGVLLVDELEASLHPMLAQLIVRQFNDPSTNPRNAQLIFTTHDTNLLGTTLGDPALRRDQVWFTEKDPAGATVLYPLTDFKPRKAENLERGYIQGRYGAIPFLGDFTISAE